jgi:hypothetical protein
MYNPACKSPLDDDMSRRTITNELRDQNHKQEVPRGDVNVMGDV